jgi:hypothetical protein
MKNAICSGIIVLAVALLAPQILQAQGTMTYLSNLTQASAGSITVGSNSWVAFGFRAGPDASGYVLNSVQLAMTDALGNPNGFTVFLYSAVPTTGGVYSWIPVSNLGTVSDSLTPTTGGIYTFNTVSNLMLAPNKTYFIVLTAGTAVANGAYELSYTGATNDIFLSDGWVGYGGVWTSTNGALPFPSSHFSPTYGNLAQFAINATAIPEPSVLGLFGLGGLAFLWHRRKAKSV